MASKALTGARCVLRVNNQIAGVFSSVSWGAQYDVQPLYILGLHNVGELVYTALNEISVRASGFRVIKNGPFMIGSVPALQNILTFNDITLTITDRATGEVIMTVLDVKPTGFDSSSSAKGVVDLNVSFVGKTLSDENSGPQKDTGGTSGGVDLG